MRYVVSHRTAYTYGSPVRDSRGIYHLSPRDLPWQEVASHSVTVDPMPIDLHRDSDTYGNAVTYFQVTEAHRELMSWVVEGAEEGVGKNARGGFIHLFEARPDGHFTNGAWSVEGPRGHEERFTPLSGEEQGPHVHPRKGG